MYKLKIYLIIIVVSLTSACATIRLTDKEYVKLANNEISIIRAVDLQFFEHLFDALLLKDIVQAYVTSVDGKSYHKMAIGYPYEIALEPGKRKLKLVCNVELHYFIKTKYITYEFEKILNVKAGNLYQIRANIVNKDKCELEIETKVNIQSA